MLMLIAETKGRIAESLLNRRYRTLGCRPCSDEPNSSRPRTSAGWRWTTAGIDRWRASDPGWGRGDSSCGTGVGIAAATARTHAHMGRSEAALRRLLSVLPAIERAPGWVENYVRIVLRRRGDAVAHRTHGSHRGHRTEPAQEGDRARLPLSHD